MIHLDGSLTTDNMAFVVTLMLSGYDLEIKRGDKNAIWIIHSEDLDDDVQHHIDDFQAGRCRVEPKRFAREFAAVRKDAYRVQGINDRPKGQAIGRGRPS